ncbi:MAG: hypothetical protein ABIN10_06315, partial [Specibacter sp.]
LAVLRPAHIDPDAEQPVGAPAGNASSGTAPSAKAAWLVGLALLVFAAFALFAQLMFPLSMTVHLGRCGDTAVGRADQRNVAALAEGHVSASGFERQGPGHGQQ